MLNACQLRHTNIAEYLIYMWQVEDMLRLLGLDIEQVDKSLVSQHKVDESTRRELHDWYEGLIMMMQRENVQKSGHLQINKNTLLAMSDLHDKLLRNAKFSEYNSTFSATLPLIVELRAKQPEDNRTGEIETCLNALYGYMLLRLKGSEVSEPTKKAMAQISKFIALLAAYFKKHEEDDEFASQLIED